MANTRKTANKEPETERNEEAVVEKKTASQQTASQPSKRRKILASLDPNELVELESRVMGTLIYVSTTGYTIEWSEFGDVHLVPISELIKMRNEQPAFFRNHWVYPISENSDSVIEALQLDRYYQKLSDLQNFDDLFDYEPEQLALIMKDEPVFMKENVARRAEQMIADGKLDSVSVIDAIEKATGYSIRGEK